MMVINHRLNGSSSPVLTATCLSYGSLCDFLGFFFPNRPGGHTPWPILTQNGSNDVGSCKDVPFGVKITTFQNPWPPDPQNCQNLPNFGRDLENFRSISCLTLRWGEIFNDCFIANFLENYSEGIFENVPFGVKNVPFGVKIATF